MSLGLRAALVLAVLAYLPQLIEQFESPKAAVVRVLGGGLLVAALVIRWRGAPGARHAPTQAPAPRWHPLDVAMLAWLLVEIVSTSTSVSRTISVLGDTAQHEGLLTSLGLAGLYAAARATTHGPGSALRTLSVAAGAVAAACVVGLWQLATFSEAQWQNAAQFGGLHRPFGSLGHANLLGAMAAAALAFAAGQVAARRRGPLVWAGLAVLLGVTIVLTLSRAAWLAALVGSGTALALGALAGRLDFTGRRRTVALAGALAAVAIVIAMAVSIEPLRARLLELLTLGSGSGRARIEIWKSALAAWKAHPWLGIGPDTFGLLFDRYQTPDYWRHEWGTNAFHAHSVYLHTLATRGIAGALAAAAVLGTAAVAWLAAWRKGADARVLAAALAGWFLAFAVSGLTGAVGIAGAALVAATLGTLPGLVAPARPDSRQPASTASKQAVARERTSSRASKRHAATPRSPAPAIAGGLASVLMLLPTLSQERASHAAFLSSAETVDVRAMAFAGRAERLAPWSDVMVANASELLRRHALQTRDPAGALALAESLARRSIQLAPSRLNNHGGLALVQVARAGLGIAGADTAAAASIARCFEAGPYNLHPLLRFIDASNLIERPDLALPVARRAVAIYPEEGLPLAMLGRCQIALGDTAAGRASMSRSLEAVWRESPSRRERVERIVQSLEPSPSPSRIIFSTPP